MAPDASCVIRTRTLHSRRLRRHEQCAGGQAVQHPGQRNSCPRVHNVIHGILRAADSSTASEARRRSRESARSGHELEDRAGAALSSGQHGGQRRRVGSLDILRDCFPGRIHGSSRYVRC